ncbi:MAG: DUF1801 domain-containing protein [Bacteroidia bacterium]|nr:DUF1801 domain-containing protein [Bacteroidia bacterium]
MNKFQNVDFGSVEEFLDFLPDHERAITELLRSLVLECVPEAKEKLSFNVPFYHRHYSLAFIWPGSVQWGAQPREGVQLGFAQGYLIEDDLHWLERGTRKQVYWKTFYQMKEIDPDLVRAYLYAAVEIDGELWRQKNASRKK